MKTLYKSFFAALIVGVLALGAMALLPAQADAVVIGGPHVCNYYSDATYQNVVGARGQGCCGEPISWGITTSYVQCQGFYCLDVICPW